MVADQSHFTKDPKVDGVIHGHFWLSGYLLNAHTIDTEKASEAKKKGL